LTLVEAWAIQAEERIGEGLSKWEAYKEVSQDYGFSVATVYRRLTPGQNEKHKKCALAYRASHKTERAKLQRWYRQQPESRKAYNDYMRKYKKTRYHLHEYADSLLSTSPTSVTLDELSEGLTEKTGFRFRRNTILNCIEEYEPDLYVSLNKKHKL